MNANDFCYWLQGFFELTDAKSVDEKQVEVIKEHLSLVFNKVTTKSVTPMGIDDPGLRGILDCASVSGLTEVKLC